MSHYYHFVYLTTNIVNGKQYLGKHSTKNINDRYLGSGIHLQQAIKKYGRKSFVREILSFHETSVDAYEEEGRLCLLLNLKNNSNFYNATDGGMCGPDHTGGSSWNKGLPKEQQPNYGNHPSEENLRLLSINRRGELNPMYGHKYTPEETNVRVNNMHNKLQEMKLNGTYIPPNQGKTFSKSTTDKMSLNNGRFWKNKTTAVAKKIYQINKDTGEIIEEWPSMRQATLKYPKNNITSTVLKKKGTSVGFIWVAEEDLDKVEEIIRLNKISKTHTGAGNKPDIVHHYSDIYYSYNEASIKTKITSYKIQKMCKNKTEGWWSEPFTDQST